MKKILLSLILVISTQAQAIDQSFFENTNSSVEATNLNSTVLEAHRVLALMSRMSVFAMLCSTPADNSRFSNVYRSLFAEQNRGMVRYQDQTFTNPIEGMRNVAMLKFMRDEQATTGGRDAFCDKNRAEFQNFLYMSTSQVQAYARLSLSDQLSYLNTVRTVSQSNAQVSTQPVEQPEIQIDPDSD